MALAASNYRTPAGVVFAEPLEDQVALLDWVDAHVGRPRQVITWGNSGGGVLATLLAERHPDRIDGAIPLCGPLGGIGTQFNLTLDFAFAVRTLLAPGSDLELVRITDPDATAARVDEIVQGAVGTPQGRARARTALRPAGTPRRRPGPAAAAVHRAGRALRLHTLGADRHDPGAAGAASDRPLAGDRPCRPQCRRQGTGPPVPGRTGLGRDLPAPPGRPGVRDLRAGAAPTAVPARRMRRPSRPLRGPTSGAQDGTLPTSPDYRIRSPLPAQAEGTSR